MRDIRNELYEKIQRELALYECSMLQNEPHEIYKAAYEICAYQDIAQSIDEEIDEMDDATVEALLNTSYNIIRYIYNEWIDFEDSAYEELAGFVEQSLLEQVRST